MAFLGLVSLLHPIRLLPGDRRRSRFHHWESDGGRSSPPARRDTFHRPTDCLVSGPLHYIPRLDLHPSQDTHPHQSYFQRHGGRGFPRIIFGSRRGSPHPSPGGVIRPASPFRNSTPPFRSCSTSPVVT